MDLFGFGSAANKANKQLAKGRDALNAGYNDVSGMYSPYRQGGSQAYGMLSDLAGLNGAASGQAAMQNFTASPGYQFRLQEGVNALDRSAASRGMLNSGAQMKALSQYGQGLASEEYGNWLQQLQGLNNQGFQATGQVADSRNLLSQLLNQSYGQAGANQANAGLANGGMWGSLAGTVLGGLF